MNAIRFFFAVCLLLPYTYGDARAADNIAVLENFSTINCDASKPVDDIFHDIALAGHKNLISFSCHTSVLDDVLKDPLANEFCDFRYDAYDRTLDEAPVLVLNGHLKTNGQFENVIHDGLALAHSLDEIRPIQLTLTDESLQVSLPALKLDKPTEIWLLAYKKSDPLHITEGPLAGNDMDYVHVVKSGQKLIGNWQGQYRNLSVPTDPYPGDGYIVLAQNPGDLQILAAGQIEKENIKDSGQE